MKKIPLTKGKYAIVDDEDYPYLSRFNWSYGGTGHAVRTVGFSYPKRWAFGIACLIKAKGKNDRYVFKNGNPLDLRKCNLTTKSFSNASIGQGKCRPQKTSKYRGVCKDKRTKCWCAYVNWSEHHKGKRIRCRIIKYFIKEINAVKWRDKKARELYGEFAYQNKV